ncbi:MAG TPA: GNAT family N-acetyltransferase [Ornithinimicrobium sp.]|nr:GNAT family N-acetyltransferase [Ornithinimicrobium sp.]
MRRVRSHAELLELSGGDPWVRWALDPALPGEAWVHGPVALVERLGGRRGFWVAPLTAATGADADAVRAALVALRDGDHLRRLRSSSVSVVRPHASVAHEVLDLGPGGDWDWMWSTSSPPADSRESELEVLDDGRDAEELSSFARVHNPRVWTEIGTGRVVRWVGRRDAAGRLTAVGGAEREAGGVPHLAGIVTATDLRGRGWGTVVTAALTRWALQEHGVCTLGVFADNRTALRVYRRLGYRTARAWHSRRLAQG